MLHERTFKETKETALQSVVSSLVLAETLPGQVFRGVWDEFLFFESDRMFNSSFIGIANEFMSIEGSASCCLVNLNRMRLTNHGEVAAIYIDSYTTGAEYEGQLRSGGAATGWLFSMDRYGCASDQGSWIIYTEKDNDVAVVALRVQNGLDRFASPLERLHAKVIDTLILPESGAPFPFLRLTPKWRNGLVEQYGRRRLRAKSK